VGRPVLDCALALVILRACGAGGTGVKLTSSGPAFYAQTRVGRNGRRFTILKLRTMRHRCEDAIGPRWSLPHDDDRVTASAGSSGALT